jgi:hypothetical protein
MKNDHESRPSTAYGYFEGYPEDKFSDRREDDRCRVRDNDRCPFPKRCNPKDTILACGRHPEDAIFEIDDDRVEEHQTFILDRVNVNTSCLCDPLVKIEFSSLVFFKAEAKEHEYVRELEVDLLFELVRHCHHDHDCDHDHEKREEILQTWRFVKKFEIEKDDKLKLEISEPFTVTFCDKERSGCCTYSMKVTGKDFKGEFDALRVVKPDISAIAQDMFDDWQD